MNRKSFLISLGGAAGILPLLSGCSTLETWSDANTEKLKGVLEQAGFVLSVTLGKTESNKSYLELAASSFETAVADGKFDPSDVLALVIANVKNDAVVLGVSTALVIYRIWFNDYPSLSTTVGVVLLTAFAKGLRNGLASRLKITPKVAIPSFKSKSLDNAVKDFFKRYN